MSYKEMKELAKLLSTYQKPRLTLFGNALVMVKDGKVRQKLDGDNTRTKQKEDDDDNNNGDDNNDG